MPVSRGFVALVCESASVTSVAAGSVVPISGSCDEGKFNPWSVIAMQRATHPTSGLTSSCVGGSWIVSDLSDFGM